MLIEAFSINWCPCADFYQNLGRAENSYEDLVTQKKCPTLQQDIELHTIKGSNIDYLPLCVNHCSCLALSVVTPSLTAFASRHFLPSRRKKRALKCYATSLKVKLRPSSNRLINVNSMHFCDKQVNKQNIQNNSLWLFNIIRPSICLTSRGPVWSFVSFQEQSKNYWFTLLLWLIC